jgi:hypothetical protein
VGRRGTRFEGAALARGAWQCLGCSGGQTQGHCYGTVASV